MHEPDQLNENEIAIASVDAPPQSTQRRRKTVASKKSRTQVDAGSLLSSTLTYGGALCSLNLNDVDDPLVYVSHFMNQAKNDMRKLHGLQQQMVDFLFVEDDVDLEET